MTGVALAWHGRPVCKCVPVPCLVLRPHILTDSFSVRAVARGGVNNAKVKRSRAELLSDETVSEFQHGGGGLVVGARRDVMM